MTVEKIYEIFKRELDGEEFASDDDAVDAADLAYRTILAEKDWEFLKKSSTLTAGTTALSGITDLNKVLKAWSVTGTGRNDRLELKKADFNDRFNTEKDYYIDHVVNTINLIDENHYTGNALVVDYIYRPATLTLAGTPVLPTDFHPLLAYRMILDFKESDQDLTAYNEALAKYNKLLGLLVDYNESLKTYA